MGPTPPSNLPNDMLMEIFSMVENDLATLLGNIKLRYNKNNFFNVYILIYFPL